MNRPPESFVLVQENRLLEFTTACFEKAGLTHDHAASSVVYWLTLIFVEFEVMGHGQSTAIAEVLKMVLQTLSLMFAWFIKRQRQLC